MKKVILDLDGVLVDFVGGAFRVFQHEYTVWPEGQYGVEKIIGVSLDKLWSEIDCEGFKFWNTLQWTEDGKAILYLLELYFGKENIVICTSPSKNPESASGKLSWIKRELPEYSRRYLIGPAKEFCANPNHYMIDDYEKNTEKFIANGGNAFLVPRIWNARHAEADRVIPTLKQQVEEWIQ